MTDLIDLLVRAAQPQEGELNWISLAAIFVANMLIMRFTFLYCQYKKRTDWVDVSWAYCIVLSCVICALIHAPKNFSAWWVIIISGIWYMRLGNHLFRRIRAHNEEDSRYATMRQAITQRSKSRINFHSWYILFFIAQAILAFIFSLHIWRLSQIQIYQTEQLNPILSIVIFIIANLIVLVSFYGQMLADNQLSYFKKEIAQNKLAVCNIGLWKYSRHPNYFFEWLHWLSYPLVGSLFNIHWLWCLPVLMYVLLVYITGIPFNEKQALIKRGNAYKKYQQSTPRFFPIKRH